MLSQRPEPRPLLASLMSVRTSSRVAGVAPIDSDRDGLFDEDPPNDLDGDGNIVQMRIHTPGEGTHRLSLDDERILERVGPGEKGDWTFVYSEGFDDDGDGRTNEDGLGGYDMNRSWPSLWQPEHVQGGAGPYPLYCTGPRCARRRTSSSTTPTSPPPSPSTTMAG